MEHNITKLNEYLKRTEDKFDSIGGYESMLSGLVTQVSEIYGENTAKNFCYQIGSKPGEKIAQKILELNNGKLYSDPVEAFINLMSRIKAYYDVKIISIDESQPGIIKIKFNNRCYLDNLFTRNNEIKKGGIICRVTRGYLEMAMKVLTGKKPTLNCSVGADNLCAEELVFN
jgi:hypothetical protein